MLQDLVQRVNRWRWSRLSLGDVEQRFATPGRVNSYMQTCFEYVRDILEHGREEHWMPPHCMFERRRGDCEDYALFAHHVLDVNGYDARVFAVFNSEEGHAACVCREGRSYATICNRGLSWLGRITPRTEDVPDQALARRAADAIYPGGWECCSFVERFEVIETGPHTPNELIPEFEWIYPDGDVSRRR